MRDPERIDEVLEALREAWIQFPDARLTQLVANAAYEGMKKTNKDKGVPLVSYANFDTFYVEDDVLLRGLRF